MRGTRARTLFALCAAIATSLVAVACGSDDESSSEPTLVKEGELLVGTDTPYPPFEIGKPPDISGYDIEVMNAIANEMDLEVTYQDTAFDTIFQDVAIGKFDTAAAASTIKEGREETVDFTDPYFQTKQALVVVEDSEIASEDDLDGVVVAAQDATTGETYANDETDAEEVRGFPEGPDAINAIKGGQADAAIIDLEVAKDAEETGGVVIAQEIETDEQYGFAVAPDNDALREDMNEALQTIKDDGTLNELYEEYFDTKAPEDLLSAKNELLT